MLQQRIGSRILLTSVLFLAASSVANANNTGNCCRVMDYFFLTYVSQPKVHNPPNDGPCTYTDKRYTGVYGGGYCGAKASGFCTACIPAYRYNQIACCAQPYQAACWKSPHSSPLCKAYPINHFGSVDWCHTVCPHVPAGQPGNHQ